MKKYNKIINKKIITVDEAIDMVDGMYQDRMKQIEENNTIYVDRLDNITFTGLEFASVILLRKVQILRRKLKNRIPKKKIEEKIKELKEMNVEGEVFTTAVNFAMLFNDLEEG